MLCQNKKCHNVLLPVSYDAQNPESAINPVIMISTIPQHELDPDDLCPLGGSDFDVYCLNEDINW